MSSIEGACGLTGVIPPKEKDGASRTPFSVASRLMASAGQQCWRAQTRSMMSPWSPVAKSYHWLRSALTLNEGVSSGVAGSSTNSSRPW